MYKQIRIKPKSVQEDVIEVDEDRVVRFDKVNDIFHYPAGDWMEVRAIGNFGKRAIYLPRNYDYVIGVDNLGEKILVVLKKEGSKS